MQPDAVPDSRRQAPGFCRATTGSIIIADAADFLSGGLELTVRSPSQVAVPFKGFKLAFSAVGTPHHHGGHEVRSRRATDTRPALALCPRRGLYGVHSDQAWVAHASSPQADSS